MLRLYPRPYHERFGEGMEQTFGDVLRERAEEEQGLFGCALWMFSETSAKIFRERMTIMTGHNRRLIGIMLAVAFILMIPLVAMQFTDEVAWTMGDFIVMGILLSGAGLTVEVAMRMTGNRAYRAGIGVAVAAGLILVWINLAVGLIGSEDNPLNTMYFGVLVIGFAGAIIAQFRPIGMARALFATAIAQALVPVIALFIGRPSVSSIDALMGIVGVFALNSFFVMLFVGSALLFRRAGATFSDRN